MIVIISTTQQILLGSYVNFLGRRGPVNFKLLLRRNTMWEKLASKRKLELKGDKLSMTDLVLKPTTGC